MKKIIFTSLLALVTIISHAQTHTGNLSLNSQTAIDTFNFTEVTGNLTISNSSITNLDGLSGLTEIGGYLYIVDNENDSLTSLSGLESLTEIGGDLNIQSNLSLSSLSGLGSLTEIGGFLNILRNDSLTSLSGLESLTEIGGYLNIDSNPSLPSLSGLESLTEIGGYLNIDSNPSLPSLSGLESLTEIGGYLIISFNPSLTSLSGLESLTEIGGDVDIQVNISLTSLSGLESLTEIGGYLNIFFNGSSLTSLSGLESLTEIGGYLNIDSNPSLTSLSGLDSLTEIGGYLTIQSNDSLTSLSGLASLTEIGGYLTISSNPSLTSLSGLEMLDSIGSNLTLTSNTALTDFCAISSSIGDDKQITSGEYTVTTNGYNSPYTFIQNESLCSNADGEIFDGDLALTSQAAIDIFNYRGVTGNLTIQGSSITNLDSLESLTDIGGYLDINNNSSLMSLSGLESLTEIGGYLNIFFNGSSLTSLSGLESLTEIGGYLNIGFNPSLTSLSGLDSLTDIGGFLDISNNASLPSLSGLASLTEIGGYLDIQSNDSLTSLSGLEMLDSIGDTLTITGNTALTDFCAISSLIGDDKQITSTEYTVNTNGYNSPYTFIQNESLCSNADGEIFDGDLALTSQAAIDTFNYRGVTGNLTIQGSSITNLDSLRGLTGIGGHLTIQSNGSLASLSSLGSLTDIGGNLHIQNNATLTSLSGLGSLTDIGGYLYIGFNNSFMSLSGLDSLTEIGEFLTIRDNSSLTSLSGLEMLDSIGGLLSITGNPALTDFCAISSLIGDDKQITSGEYSVIENGYNPPYNLIDDENYCSNLDGGIFIGDLTVNNQAAIDTFNYRRITGNLTINDATNGNITNLDGLSGLTEIRGNLFIINNSSLTSLSGLESLTETGGFLTIRDNASLPSLSGLEMLDSIGGTLTLTSNPALTDFCAISSLIGDDKQITLGEYTLNTNGYNPSYTLISNKTFCSNADGGIFMGDLTVNNQDSINAFRYRGITGNLTINDSINANITNLDSLIGLTEVRGFLDILSNDSLTSLSGLELLDSIGDTLTITGNTALTDFCAISSLIGDDKQITMGEYILNTNGYNPSFEEIQRSHRCSTNPPEVVATLQNVTTRSTVPFAIINVAPAFSDPNRDTLIYTATSSDTAIVTVAITDSTLTLTEVSTGMATITVTATDDSLLSVSDVFMAIIAPNNPPVVENPLAAIERVSGRAFAAIDLSATFSDPDGDALTYTVASSDAAIVTAALSDTTLTLTETGTGTATITVTATDAFGLSVDASFMVTITNNTAPTVATALTDVSIESGTAFETIDLSATFSDENGDALSYTAMSDNETVVTVSLSNTTLTLTETGTGTATITVTATDPGGLSVSDSVMITVEEGETALGIAETDILAVYPNPSSGVFQLSKRADVVRVYDMSGRLIYRGRKVEQLNLTSSPAGNYLVEVRVGKESGKYTVIRE